jgi:hypothetical protein
MDRHLLLEYEKLKDEQRTRITIRENLFYTTLLVIGAILSSLLSVIDIRGGYLAITPVLFVISNSYYYNDEIIGRINIYIREELRPRLAAVTNLDEETLFGWEAFTRTHRIRRRLYQFAANLILYPGSSGIALFFFLSDRRELGAIEHIGVAICIGITGLMFIQALHCADLSSSG